MNIKFVLTVVVALAFAGAAIAGNVADADGDGVPDSFDNCGLTANGANDALNQTDDDSDGFGTSCDCDFDQDGIVLGSDISLLNGAFNSQQSLYDIDGDGWVLATDLVACYGMFNQPPGPNF